MAIMLMQTGAISFFLYASGTVDTLNNNSIDFLTKNVQNRGLHLEQLMVNYWSNIGGLERDVAQSIRQYLDEQGIEIDELLGNREREIELLHMLSYHLIDSMRVNVSTGVFMYFLSGDEFSESVQHLNGLYFRNLNPMIFVRDNLIFVRGHIDIARRHGIQHHNLWDEFFTFDPRQSGTWRGFSYPQIAAADFPNATAAELSFWTRPHLLNPESPLDTSVKITYTRPVFLDGRLIAMVGSEVQMTHMERFFPAMDLANFDESGYMLYMTDSQGGASEILRITGAYMNRLFGNLREINLNSIRYGRGYYPQEIPDVRVIYLPLRLYSASSPFANQRWSLAAISTENSLFAMSRTFTRMVLYGSGMAFLLGGIFLFFAIKSFIRPITQRRLQAEQEIREERQRYLLALESSADTFVEYDIGNDTLDIYYFTGTQQQTPECMSIPSFLASSRTIFHPDDTFDFFRDDTHEIRMTASIVKHITNADPLDGYFWFDVRTMVIKDNDDHPIKIIGTAREKTHEKSKELSDIETSHRDLTTGFLNRDFGLKQIQSRVSKNQEFTLTMVQVINFEMLEYTYGLMFGGVFIAEFGHMLSRLVENTGFVVRMANDEFLIFNNSTEIPTHDINQAFGVLYCGDETDFPLSLHIEQIDYENEFPMLKTQRNENPVNVSIDVSSKAGINGVAIELLERTSHISSAIRILIGLLGRLFALDRIVICSFDAGFNTTQIIHEWRRHGNPSISTAPGGINKVTTHGLAYFTSILGANDTLVFAHEQVDEDYINPLLCITPGESVSGYCCILHEDAGHAGRMVFMSEDPGKEWPEEDKSLLLSIAKIFATYLNVEKSRSASKAKSRFLARVSHEIRTPMNAIIGMANIAKSAAGGEDHNRVDDCLSKISVAANFLLYLVNDVLEMSRIESGQTLQIERKPFSLHHFIDDVEDVIRFAIENNGIEFNVTCEIRNDNVIADEHRLKQVVINLLGNANKFTKPGGIISLSIAESADGRFRFAVKDNGVGIPYDKQSAIFAPFEQADTPAVNQQGTGLGLSISKNIITAMHSTIELESEPGKGSEFSFTLDLTLADTIKEDVNTQHTPDYTTLFAGKRVLVVDDVEVNIEIVAFILESIGFDVDTASNGREAVDAYFAAPNGHYDAILMDIQMPVMDGIEAARAIRGCTDKPDARTIPIIALTANAFDEDLKKSVESGMNSHVSKPIDSEELLGMLQKFLKGE